MKSEKRIFVIFSFFSEVSTKAANLILFPLLAKSLGTHGYGIYVQILAISGMLVPLATLGLPIHIVREISGVNNKTQNSRHFLTNLILIGIASIFLGAIIITFAPIISALLFKTNDALSIIRLSSLLILFTSLDALVISYYRAFLKIVEMSLVEVIKAIVTVIFILILIKQSDNLYNIFILLITVQAFSFFAKLLYIFAIKKINIQLKILSLSKISESIKFGMPAIIAGMGSMILSSGDRTLIGYFYEPDSVGKYGAAYTLAGILAMFGAPFFTPMYPEMAKFKNNKNIEMLYSVCKKYMAAFLIICIPAMAGLIVLSQSILVIVASEEFYVSKLIFGIIILGLFSDLFTVSPRYLLYLENDPKFLQNTILLGGGINIMLNILLLPIFGILGAAIATLIAYFLISGLLLFKINAYGYSISKLYNWKSIIKIIAASSIMLVAINLIQKYFYPSRSIKELFILVIIGFVIYLVSLFSVSKFKIKKLLT